MPTISSAGVGSGLDVQGLVSQLVAAERAPVASRLARQESSINVELSAFGRLKSAVSGLDSALETLAGDAVLDGRSVTVQDESVFNASVSSGAAMGTYDIEVQQLAQSHRLAAATPINPPGSDVGYGNLDLQLGSDSFTVVIDAGSPTLADIRNAINNATDNPGIIASIITVDGGEMLQLGSNRTGTDSEIQLSATGGDGGLNTLIADLGTVQNFQDAIIQINGNAVTSSSNSITGAIQGVTIDLASALPGQTRSLTVSRDNEGAIEAFESLVSAYNTYLDEANGLGGFNADTGRGGALIGDSILRGLNGQLRATLSQNFGAGNITSLQDLGISTAVDGTLSLDSSALGAALSNDFNGVQSFLTDTGGFAESIQAITTGYIESDGLIESRLDSLNERLDRVESGRDALDLRLERVRARYLSQFSALDAMLAQLQQTSNYLSQQLASLPGVNSGNSS